MTTKKTRYTYDITWKDGSNSKLTGLTASLAITLTQYGLGEEKIQEIAEWRRTAYTVKENKQ